MARESTTEGHPRARALRRSSPRFGLPALTVGIMAALFASWAGTAHAGQASLGHLLFHPCKTCHPIAPGQTASPSGPKLPNGFKKHAVRLVGHDKLGKGSAACAACHEPPTADPGKLKLAGGGLVDIKGDVSQVCYRCHSTKYKEFRAGVHGKRQAGCTAAGCHDPHTPGFMFISPLLPILGTGLQAQVLPERRPFTPLPPPAPTPPVSTPPWLAILTALGLLLATGIGGSLVFGRWQR